MSNSRYPFRLNIGFMLNQPVGSSREVHFEAAELAASDLRFQNITGKIRISRTQQGLFADGIFQASVEQNCVRCLSDYIQPLSTEFSELYAFKNSLASESGLVIPEDGNIDFAPIISEYLVIEVPIKPLCMPECKGLCPICGENLNLRVCEHQQQESD